MNFTMDVSTGTTWFTQQCDNCGDGDPHSDWDDETLLASGRVNGEDGRGPVGLGKDEERGDMFQNQR
jgi:hypothetical protein